MVYNTDVGNNDEYKVDFTPEQTGTSDYLARFSTNLGASWTYAYTDDNQRGRAHGQPVERYHPARGPGQPAPRRAASANSMTVGWDANSEPDLYRYEVWRSTTSGGPYTKLANVPAGTTSTWTTL